MYQVFVESPDGEKIEVIASEDKNFSEAAQEGAKAMLAIFSDEMELEEGYQVILEESSCSSQSSQQSAMMPQDGPSY